MGGLNFLGLGGSTPKSIGGTGQKPLPGGKMPSKNPKRIIRKFDVRRGGEIANKLNKITISAKSKVKSERWKTDSIKERELSKKLEDSEIIGKSEEAAIAYLEKEKGFTVKDKEGDVKYKFGSSSYNIRKRKKIEDALVKERMPEDTGPTAEDRRRLVAQVKAGAGLVEGKEQQGMAAQLENRRTKRKKDRKAGGAAQAGKTAYAGHIGVGGIKHKTTIGGEETETGIKSNENSASANTPSGGKASVDAAEHAGAAGVEGRHGNQAKAEEDSATPQKSSMQQVQIKGSSGPTVSESAKNEAGLDQNPEGQESFGGVFTGGLVNKSSDKLIDFKAEIQRIKDADQAEESVDGERENLKNGIKEMLRYQEAVKKAASVSENNESDDIPGVDVAQEKESAKGEHGSISSDGMATDDYEEED